MQSFASSSTRNAYAILVASGEIATSATGPSSIVPRESFCPGGSIERSTVPARSSTTMASPLAAAIVPSSAWD
jgi:hypothetical protein